MNDDGTIPARKSDEVYAAGEDPYVSYTSITDQLADIIGDDDYMAEPDHQPVYVPEPEPQPEPQPTYTPEPAP